ncbi:hypothetical protein NDU88_006616 [Pleurodeles waltl]|uniref:Uncharacterized protein n=1 Tax=Pleurodeles waltl TaxID=8319 RepID=A0AAV7QKI9_PLEWA|nr:hypothetical protein NDU88_006616 [Pleurodeles waltl]
MGSSRRRCVIGTRQADHRALRVKPTAGRDYSVTFRPRILRTVSPTPRSKALEVEPRSGMEEEQGEHDKSEIIAK